MLTVSGLCISYLLEILVPRCGCEVPIPVRAGAVFMTGSASAPCSKLLTCMQCLMLCVRSVCNHDISLCISIQ